MKQPPNFPKELLDHAESLMKKNIEFKQIESSLDRSGYNTELISQVIAYLKKQKHAQELNYGVRLLITGILILLISCVVTIYLFHTNISVNFFMYLSSGAGIIFCFMGFRKIFG